MKTHPAIAGLNEPIKKTVRPKVMHFLMVDGMLTFKLKNVEIIVN
jgi:hypothetical protein